MTHTSQQLAKILRLVRLPYTNELILQNAVAEVLQSNGVEFSREHRFDGRDRVDFFISGGIALECKVDGPATSALSQMMRYAEHDEVTSIILVTCRARHMTEMRDFETIMGKPFHIVWAAAL
jgi:hypothetical protein